MVKKKPAHNAFYYFMIDYKNQHANCKDMRDAADMAGPVWKSMPPAARKPYEEKAKRNKNKGVKLNSLGQNLDVVENAENELMQKQFNMKDDIDKVINVAAKASVLQEQIFYILHINDYFFCNSNNRYYPAEIAVVAFNLRDGIGDIYHKIIVPDEVPLGYSFYARENADATHKIVIDPDAPGTDMYIVFNEIFNLIKTGEEVKLQTHPLYVSSKLMDKAENVFQNMALDAASDESVFKIYSVEYLFYALRNAAASNVVFPTVGVAELELERDLFEFKQGMACPYHENTDAPQACSLSIVLRTIYAICNHCCKDIGIQLIPGQHVPPDAEIKNYKAEKEEDDFDVAQQLSVYDDDEEDTDIDVKYSVENDFFNTNTDTESDGGFILAKRGRHYMEKYSSQETSTQCSSSGTTQGTLRIPITHSKIAGENAGGIVTEFPRFGRGRGRGRGLLG